MRIGVDKNQLSGSHATSNAPKHRQMTKAGASLEPLRLPYGDYILIDDDVQSVLSTKPEPRKKDLIGHIKRSIDTKKDIPELWMDVTSDHERFRAEISKAKQDGVEFIVLIEDASVECLEDVFFYHRPEVVRSRFVRNKAGRLPAYIKVEHKQREIKGESLYRCMQTISTRYGVRFEFCTRRTAGKRIMELLSDGK